MTTMCAISVITSPPLPLDVLSVIVRESVPEVENVGRPILMKLGPEVGLIEIFQKPSWFCSLTFSSKVTGGSHLGPPEHEKFCF